MHKRFAMLFILTILVIGIVACDSNESATTPTAEPVVGSVDIGSVDTEATAEDQVDSAVANDSTTSTPLTYPIVDTNQGLCYNNSEQVDCPSEGEAFYGQDAQYTGNEPSYTDNGDGTIIDNVTGLVWTQEISSYSMPWSDAAGYCESLEMGSITDWRLPNVKELWSIRGFSQGWPWVDTDYFYLVGDGSMLAQHHSWTSNLYLVESEYQNEQVQGDPAWIVNDWTGHIKAMSGSRFVRCVSGDEYGINDFVDNGDGTVTDNATGLMWAQDDSGETLDWETALAYAADATIAGYDDWRLPSAKELQSIADYSGVFPAMDTSVFNLSEITNVVYDTDSGEQIDTQVSYPGYWTSTSNPVEGEDDAVEGGNIYAWLLVVGYNPDTSGYDLHGAGSVVFDTKAEAVSDGTDYEIIYHHARLVRDGDVTETPDGDPATIDTDRVAVFEDGEIDASASGPGGAGGQGPDFAAAAEQLGVTEEALMEALGEPGQQPDFATAAATLGVTAEELEAALMDASGAPEGDPREEGAPADPESTRDTEVKFTLTDTKQEFSYDNDGNAILFPAEGEAFYGQDAQYVGLEPSFRDNGDGTVSDLVTGLVWEKTPTFDTYQHEDGVAYCESLSVGGYDDWRLPTIKELYSLADYRGELLLDDVSTPYIDTTYFDFEYPAGDRQYAGQYWSSTRYEVTPNSDEEDQMKYFGFNFADGHIKAYGTAYSFDGTPVEGVLAPGMYVRCVSGAESVYGVNQFVDNGDGTVTDTATGLMWQQTDDGQTRIWEEALAYAENLELAGYDDWRLPNAKELQSIVQYGKAEIPAIDESFFTLTNPDSYFWTSTTHGDFKYQGIYIAFGPAWSIPVSSDSGEYIDEHGAGAQRSDPKTGEPEDYNISSENAADLVRINNYVLSVRNVAEQPVIQENTGTLPTSTGTPVAAPAGDQGNTEGQVPDLAAAAATLGIPEDELMAALESTNQNPPDLEAAADALSITAEELQAALMNSSGEPQDGAPVEQQPESSEMPADLTDTSATYTLNETGQGFCYNSDGEKIDCPVADEAFYGQDAQFTGATFDFTDNGDGTVTDNVTGLTWEQSPNSGPSSWPQAQGYCEALSLDGQDHWRMPSLKELFSISNFSAGWPYLDTTYFDLTVNDSISKDEQYWADNYYVGKTAEGQYDAAFGVNHATGHIKAYPALVTGPMGKYVRCVYGDEYLINDFVDNGDGTITDHATSLTWMQADSGEGMDWETALAYAQEMNEANYLGYRDWRLPNVKELQSIVDYDYAPDAQDEAYDGPALDPLFSVSEVNNEAGELDYPYFWTSTSARFQSTGEFHYAWYVAAGRAVDASGNDSHGAGAVRFDVKVEGGPAGEGGERVYNYVRLVRGGDVAETPDGDPDANDTALALEFNSGSEPGDGAPQGSGGPQQPDFAAAAATLGIAEDDLIAALEDTNQSPPDFEAAAEALGITAEELQAALMNSSGAPQEGAPTEEPTDASKQSDATDAGTDSVVSADADFEATDWTEETHSNDVAPNFEEVFADTEVKRLDVVVSAEDWQLMLEDMTATYGEFGQRSRNRDLQDAEDENPIWVPADIFYNGTQWYRVGFRFKGNSSLQSPWEQGNLKLPFKLDFDEFEDDYPQIDNQRFYGFKQLSLKNNYEDESFLREKVAADVFKDVGLAVSHTAFYELYVDHGDGPEYFGLYTLVEEVDDTVIETQFNSDDGNLYKPEEGGGELRRRRVQRRILRKEDQ